MLGRTYNLTTAAVLYLTVSASLFAAEGVTKLFCVELVDDVAVIGAGASGLALAWITRNSQNVQRPQVAAVWAALMFALLFGTNLPFLRWLCVDPADSVTAMEFSWFLPFYINVVWIGGAAMTAFAAAILARTKA